MKTVGITAEYNPIHPGHCFQLDYARRNLGADYIVIAMSGDFVQRGAPAIFDKYLRTRAALLCGADLILELPVSVSTASAEFFAQGAVELLDSIGVVDALCFGAEAGENGLFMETAQLLLKEPPLYQETLKAGLKTGMNFPAARSQALLRYLSKQLSQKALADFENLLSSPNNILGIEYCKALLRLNSKIAPAPLLREGFGYHDTRLACGIAPSASGIRRLIKAAGSIDGISKDNAVFAELKEHLPGQAQQLLTDALIHHAFLLEEDFDLLLHYRLLSLLPSEMSQYLDVSEELAKRIKNKLGMYAGFLPFAELLKTKEITYTRIQRALLHILLHIRKTPEALPYARVLGFRKSAAPLLKEIKKKGRIPLITSLSAAARTLEGEDMLLLQETTFASNIYESLISKKEGRDFAHEYTKPVIIL